MKIESVNIFKGNFFYKNQARGSGGAIYSFNSDFNLYENFFHNNIAEIGGALRYVEIVPLYFQNHKDGELIQKINNDGEMILKNNNHFLGNQA